VDSQVASGKYLLLTHYILVVANALSDDKLRFWFKATIKLDGSKVFMENVHVFVHLSYLA